MRTRLLIAVLFISVFANGQIPTLPQKQITNLTADLAAKQNSLGLYDITDYGATDNGSTDDDAAAIQAAIDAWAAGGKGGKVRIPKGVFYVKSALQTSVGGVNPNCQICVPYVSPLDGERATLVIEGESPPHSLMGSVFVDNPPPQSGSVIITTITGSGTAPAVFGTKGTDVTYGYENFTDILTKNLTILVPANTGGGGPTIGGLNFIYASSSPVENVTVSINGSIYASVLPTNEAAGIITTKSGHEYTTTIKGTFVYGFKYGIVTSEHTTMEQSGAAACFGGWVPMRGGHAQNITRVNLHWSKYPVYSPPTDILGLTVGDVYINVSELNVESNDPADPWNGDNRWYDQTTTIYDPGNHLDGYIKYHMVRAGDVGNNNELFSISSENTKLEYQSLSGSGLSNIAGETGGGMLGADSTRFFIADTSFVIYKDGTGYKWKHSGGGGGTVATGSFIEYWDDVTPPAVPGGWTHDANIVTAAAINNTTPPNVVTVSNTSYGNLSKNGVQPADTKLRVVILMTATGAELYPYIRSTTPDISIGGTSCYQLELNGTSGNVVLYKKVSGSNTTLATLSGALTLGTYYIVQFEAAGTTISVQIRRGSDNYYLNSSGTFVNSVQTAISVTDAAVSAGGYTGIYMASTVTPGAGGLMIDDLVIE